MWRCDKGSVEEKESCKSPLMGSQGGRAAGSGGRIEARGGALSGTSCHLSQRARQDPLTAAAVMPLARARGASWSNICEHDRGRSPPNKKAGIAGCGCYDQIRNFTSETSTFLRMSSAFFTFCMMSLMSTPARRTEIVARKLMKSLLLSGSRTS